MEIEKNEQVEWNLSSSLIIELADLLRRASNCYLQMNMAGYIKSFETLKAIKLRIVASLKKEERQAFKKLENEFYKVASRIPPDSSEWDKAYLSALQKAKPEIIKLLDNYNEAIMDSLESYGYLIPKKQDTSVMIFKNE